MNYNQTLNYLYSQLPMYQRIGQAAYKANLDNTIAICELLGNPQTTFKSVHIAGTNGKGSTSHMLASVLQAAGYKVGLYTSPHLKDFRERIRINGKMIPKKCVVEFVAEHKLSFEKIQPSFFEMTVGLAFNYFEQEKVDIAVIETGLGGRLDSTNIIKPLLSIITNISFDHQNLLGNTLKKIAQEKAGIIKSAVPVIIGQTQQEVKSVFVAAARKNKAHILFADQEVSLVHVRQKRSKGKLVLKAEEPNRKLKLTSELPGMYQQHNIPAVILATEKLNALGFNIKRKSLTKGLAATQRLTGLMGRWQILNKHPLTIADTGHNEAGIIEVLKQVNTLKFNNLHYVLGMVNDKDITKVLSLLPRTARFYFCKPNIPRGLDAEELKRQATIHNLKGQAYKSVKKALSAAKKQAKKEDLILIGGSTFVVADAL